MHKLFQCIFKQAGSKFTSDRLLHEVSILCVVCVCVLCVYVSVCVCVRACGVLQCFSGKGFFL